ncbi:peroxisomal bifunctional enzyme-like [Saccostrea echinata]|uniref:peroxisomal bifunctional enzyme-like n=1 Tax=Saccostrea echinata TaxID=191078 RepID=UPI002A81517A|nr:peroxisomal bifunctional enzyme-like [Saccostrea echinata]
MLKVHSEFRRYLGRFLSTSNANMSVGYSVQGSVAVLEVNNPPVNALSHGVRLGLKTGVERASRDRNVRSVVIIGKGQTFPAGADIREFGKPSKEPWLTDVGIVIEASPKPVVAAIHGTCLGGGLEVALFSHYRIAVPSARVGFPEVALGLLPGAGGTQRLSRLTGLPVAMDMISSGRHVPIKKAKEYGIIDEIVTGDLMKAALKYSQSVQGRPFKDRCLRFKMVPNADKVEEYTSVAMAQVKKKYKGYEAPVACVQAVRASAELPYEEGMKLERELFIQLQGSGQARAQQYAFFAERAVSRWMMPGGSYKTAKPLPVRSTAVIGAGTMGSGIAVCLLSAGLPVYLLEQNEKFLNNGVKLIENIMSGSVKLGKVSMETAKKASTLLKPTLNYSDLKDVDLVIEAVFENLDLKKDVFSKLDKLCKPSAILCTNTSTIDIDRISTATSRPDKVVGTHFFAPAYHMRLLENIYGTKTSPDTVATVMKLGKTINKVPVLVKSCHGFLANRMNSPFNTESLFLVEEGASPQEIDQVNEDFGMPMGPFKVRDLSGIDIGWRINREVAKALGTTITKETRFLGGNRYCGLNDDFFEKGRYGRKTGKGWYLYEKVGGKIPTVDSETEEIINNYRQRRGIVKRKITPQEIFERQFYSCINEGFRILEEGICNTPEEIDISWIYGFSFPKYRGGPMFYASQIGLKRVYDRICHYHETCPYSIHWVPSRLLKKLAENEVPFSQWVNHVAKSKM